MSNDNSIFYLNDERDFCKVSTRGYMRLKMDDGQAKFTLVGDGIATFDKNWGIELQNPKESVLMTIQFSEHGTCKVIDADGTVLYENPCTTLTKPVIHKELSLEELKIMRDGLNQMINWIEKNQ